MGATNKARAKQPVANSNAGEPAKAELRVPVRDGESKERKLAEVALDPAAHALSVAEPFNRGSFGKQGITETFAVLVDQLKGAKDGDRSHYRSMLAAQAISLNSIFTELARRAALNMGDYLGAKETYMRLALKAQAQSRATIEALERLANGHVQTVKHVHVNQGGQAVIADQVHNHARGMKNGKSDDQSQGTGAAGASAALPGPNRQGSGVPIASREGPEAVPDARGDESGCA